MSPFSGESSPRFTCSAISSKGSVCGSGIFLRYSIALSKLNPPAITRDRGL